MLNCYCTCTWRVWLHCGSWHLEQWITFKSLVAVQSALESWATTCFYWIGFLCHNKGWSPLWKLLHLDKGSMDGLLSWVISIWINLNLKCNRFTKNSCIRGVWKYQCSTWFPVLSDAKPANHRPRLCRNKSYVNGWSKLSATWAKCWLWPLLLLQGLLGWQ